MSNNKPSTTRIYESDSLNVHTPGLKIQAGDLADDQTAKQPVRRRQPPATPGVVKRVIERLKNL